VLPLCSSLYEVNIHAIGFFPCFFLLVFSYVAFLFLVFRLLFVFNNALASMVRLDPFDPDMCVVDVYVTLAFESR
jgi:hypothetical protein